LMANKPVVIRNPNAVRPWQHVLEPVVGYLMLASYLEKEPIAFGQAYNFGPETEETLSVEEMVKLANETWGSGEYKMEQEANQPHEAGLLKLDISKVKSELNWMPKMNANETVAFTLNWYKNFKEDILKINDFTGKQILGFLNV
jgi:CDP-glucose 4,6-dehydratase